MELLSLGERERIERNFPPYRGSGAWGEVCLLRWLEWDLRKVRFSLFSPSSLFAFVKSEELKKLWKAVCWGRFVETLMRVFEGKMSCPPNKIGKACKRGRLARNLCFSGLS